MAGRNLEEWVQKKLDEGVAPQRLKKVLKNSDHDPSIVDEVAAPFNSEGDAENVFESENEENKKVDSEKDQDAAAKDKNTGKDESYDFAAAENGERSDDKSSGLISNISLPSVSLPGFSLPKPSLPDIELRKPDIPWRLVLVLVIIAGAFYGGTLAMNSNDTPNKPLTRDSKTEFQGCPDIGVSIVSVSASRFRVKVGARVSRGPGNVVIELYNNEKMVGVKEAEFNGFREFTFNELSVDSVVMRPVGCYSVQDSVSIG